MATTPIGNARVQVPAHQDQDWHVPLDRNWNMLSALAEQLSKGGQVVSGLDATTNGLNVNLTDGVYVPQTGWTRNVTGQAVAAPPNSTSLLCVRNNARVECIAWTAVESGDFPIYVVVTDGTSVTLLSDIRVKIPYLAYDKQRVEAAANGSMQFDCRRYDSFYLTISAALTINLTNFVVGRTVSFVLNNTGGFTISWGAPAPIWPNGQAPIFTRGVDRIVVQKVTDSIIHASLAGQDYK